MSATAQSLSTKSVRQPEATRARILEAARIEFVTYGLNGARVDRIAEQAKVNKNLIYHYFGSKDGLYLEVLEAIYAALRVSQQDQKLRSMPPLEGMRQLVGNTFDHFVSTPDLIRLMSIENIHYAQNLKNSTTIKPMYRGLLDTIEDILERGQKARVFRAGVDPVDLYLSISGLAYFFLSNQHTLSWLLDRNIASKSSQKQRREHVVDMVLSYLTVKPKKSSA